MTSLPRVAVPGWAHAVALEQDVCDFNGTLVVDGVPLEGVAERLSRLSAELTAHLRSADTHGTLAQAAAVWAAAGVPAPQWARVTSGADKADTVTRLARSG